MEDHDSELHAELVSTASKHSDNSLFHKAKSYAKKRQQDDKALAPFKASVEIVERLSNDSSEKEWEDKIKNALDKGKESYDKESPGYKELSKELGHVIERHQKFLNKKLETLHKNEQHIKVEWAEINKKLTGVGRTSYRKEFEELKKEMEEEKQKDKELYKKISRRA